MVFRPEALIFQRARLLGRTRAEDRKLRKDPFGGPCLEGTLRKVRLTRHSERSEESWFSESSPVAGTIRAKSRSYNIRCRTRTRVAEMRPASHTNALGALFIPEVGQKVQVGNFSTVRKFTKLVRPPPQPRTGRQDHEVRRSVDTPSPSFAAAGCWWLGCVSCHRIQGKSSPNALCVTA